MNKGSVLSRVLRQFRTSFFLTEFFLHLLSLIWYYFTGNAPESDKKDLLSELEVMKQLKPHPHVIKLLGCVTESGKF